jgi:hypothetical protein
MSFRRRLDNRALHLERLDPASRVPQTPTRSEPQFPGHLPVVRPMSSE